MGEQGCGGRPGASRWARGGGEGRGEGRGEGGGEGGGEGEGEGGGEGGRGDDGGGDGGAEGVGDMGGSEGGELEVHVQSNVQEPPAPCEPLGSSPHAFSPSEPASGMPVVGSRQ